MGNNRIKSDKSEWPVVRIWTDGSTAPENPGPGGWAAVIHYKVNEYPYPMPLEEKEYSLRDEGDVFEEVIYGSTPWTSNIRMELTGVVRALQHLRTSSIAIIYTDSQYIIDGFRNILHRDKLLKSHYDLWGLLLHYSQIHDIKTVKVKGHSGVEGNELADQYAKLGSRGQTGDSYMTKTERMVEERRLSERGIEKNSWEW